MGARCLKWMNTAAQRAPNPADKIPGYKIAGAQGARIHEHWYKLPIFAETDFGGFVSVFLKLFSTMLDFAWPVAGTDVILGNKPGLGRNR